MTIFKPHLSHINTFRNNGLALDLSNINSKVLHKNVVDASALIFQFNKTQYDPSQKSANDLDCAALKLEQILALLNRYLCSTELNAKERIIAKNASMIIEAFLFEFKAMKDRVQINLKLDDTEGQSYADILDYSFELFKTSPLLVLKLVYFLSSLQMKSSFDLNFIDEKLTQLTTLLANKDYYLQNMEVYARKAEPFIADDHLEALIQLRFEMILNCCEGQYGISYIFEPLQELLNQMICAKMDHSIPSLELLEFSRTLNDLQEKWEQAETLNLNDPYLDQVQANPFMRQFVESYQNFISIICPDSFSCSNN